MRDRIAAAAERGDRIHLREEARFALEVAGRCRRALAIALDDWAVQKELADARLVAAAAAVAANDLPRPIAGARVGDARTSVDDVQLDKLLGAR